MRRLGLMLVAVGLLSAPPAWAQEEEEQEKRTFDVFDLEEEEEEEEAEEVRPDPPDEELPRGDADAVDLDPIDDPPPPPPPIETSTRTGPTVTALIVGANEDASLAQRIADETSRRLAAARGLTEVSMSTAIDPTAEVTRKRAIHQGRKGIDDGIMAVEELDLEVAGAKLEEGVNTLAAYFGDLSPAGRESLESGIFAYATTTLFEGLSEQADALFVALALLSPDFEPAPERYPSNVNNRFAQVRAGVDDRSLGGLTVKSIPDGASVYVDGVFRGASPVTVGGLADGYHVVTVTRMGFQPRGTLAPVTADRTSVLDLELELSDDTSRLEALTPELSKNETEARRFQAELGLSHMALLTLKRRVSSTVVSGLWLGPDGALLGRLDDLSIVEDPEVAAQTIVAALEQAEAAARIAAAPPPPAESEVWETWWFWTAVGGAVIVAAAATTAVVTTQSDGGVPRNTAVFGF